jgi:hypothetical protein
MWCIPCEQDLVKMRTSQKKRKEEKNQPAQQTIT